MKSSIQWTRAAPMLRRMATAAVFLVVTLVLMMWLMGTFHRKVSPFAQEASPPDRPADAANLAVVRRIRVPATESAVGTVRAVHETSIASKLLAKIVAVHVKAGQPVSKSDVLVQLDDTDLKARRAQAAAAVNAARAVRDQAKVEHDRVEGLMQQQAASRIELDRVNATMKSAEADLQRAEESLKETQAVLEYATIRAPMSGIVVDKKVDAGDTATPGQVLVTLYDPKRMQLVASVRESLTRRMQVGQMIPVGVDALGLTCDGQVSEIVPEAETASRSFLVKVTGPCPPGVYAGMFGRLIIPLGEEELLVVPRAAVRRVGQLDIVDVAEGDVLRRRVVQLGRDIETDVQVLSGLSRGERVAMPSPASREGA